MLIFNNPKIIESIDRETLNVYENLALVHSFKIFCQKIYKIANYQYGDNTYDDQVILILLIKYYWECKFL